MIFELAQGKNLVVSNRDNRVFVSQIYRFESYWTETLYCEEHFL